MMKVQVLLAITLLVQSSQGGGLIYTKDSCSTFAPMGSEDHIASNAMIVKFKPTTFYSGEPVTLTISSTEETFDNAFLRTVCDSCKHKYDQIGMFVRLDRELDLFDCDGHNSSAAKSSSYGDIDFFTMQWVPDRDINEQFHFEGSMILNRSHWISGYKSDTFTINTSAALRSGGSVFSILILMMLWD